MHRIAAIVAAVVTFAFAAPAAHAQLTSPVPAGFSYLYSVPGVANVGAIATYFACTSTSTNSQTVTVEVFGPTGALGTSASLVVGAGKSVLFGTQDATALSEDSVMPMFGFPVGAARILSTEKKLMCSAFIWHTVNGSPTVSLNVVAKLKQKAAN